MAERAPDRQAFRWGNVLEWLAVILVAVLLLDHKAMPRHLVDSSLAIVFASIAVDQARTGFTGLALGSILPLQFVVRREDRPVLFWFFIALYCCVSIWLASKAFQEWSA